MLKRFSLMMLAAFMGAMLVSSTSFAYSMDCTVSYDDVEGIWTYNYTGTTVEGDRIEEFDLWIHLTWNADNDGTLEAGEFYEVTGMPTGWSVLAINYPGGVSEGGDTYYSEVEWTRDGGEFHGAGTFDFQLQSYYGPGQAYFAWQNGEGIAGHIVGPVPEPTSALLLGIGLIGLAGSVRKRFRA